MKKKIILVLFLFIGISVFATEVGEHIFYQPINLSFGTQNTYLSKVTPANDGYFYVDITTIVSPGGSNSAVGVFTFTASYYLKEGDEITLYKYSFISGSSPVVMQVTKISNNSITLTEKEL